MVFDKMDANTKTWVDAAISRHLMDGTPLDEIRTYFVGSLLAQVLLYYRYDVPHKWEAVYNNADLLGLGKRFADSPGLVSFSAFGAPTIPYYDEIIQALEANCWSGYEQLPATVWNIIKEISGLTIEEWESLPVITEAALAKSVVCTRCGYSSSLRDFGNVVEYADPLTFSGGTKIHLRCKRCSEKVSYETEVMQVEKYRKKYIDARVIIIATGLITILLIAYGMFRNVL